MSFLSDREAARRAARAAQRAPLPSATEISRVLAADTQRAEYVISATGVVEEAFANVECISGLVYVHGGESGGVPQAAAGDCYLGRTSKFLTELRSVGDQTIPYLITETSLSEVQSARLWVKGTAGDKLLLIYQPA